MPATTRFENLRPEAMLAMMTSDIDTLSADQARQVDDFIDRIGGIENAWAAIDMLAELE